MTNRFLTLGLGAAGMTALLCLASPRPALAGEAAEVEFTKMDANGDGKITVDEWTDGHKAIYEKMDTNRDGKVTSDEIAVMQEKHEKMGGKPMMSPEEKLKIMDTNGDGVITEEEFVSGSKVMFERMDTNNDGALTKAEIKAGHDKMKSKMQEKGHDKPLPPK